jgi:predicted outer membrane protein
MAAAANAQPADDRHIVAAAIAANEGEVALAELALTKTQNERVRDFALTLRRDHMAALGKLRALARDANPVAADDPELREMKRDTDDSKIDTKFLPNAQDAELRSTLQRMRPTVQGHLREAESLKAKPPGLRRDAPAGRP